MTAASRSIAILGAGTIGTAIAHGFVAAQVAPPSAITLVRRDLGGLGALVEAGHPATTDARAAAADADILILAVRPQQIDGLLDELRGALDPRRHTVVSVVSGVSIGAIRSRLATTACVVRAMPNTAIAIGQSMTCLAADDAPQERLADTRALFDAVGRCAVVPEELMVPATALCACGIAFFLRAIRAASQGGVEIGFHAEEALLMASQTARGAAALVLEGGHHPEGELDRVTTPRGCTISGLNQMEHSGFSSALIKGITTAAEQAARLYASG